MQTKVKGAGYTYTYKNYDVEITRNYESRNWAVDIYKPTGDRLTSECLSTKHDCIAFAQEQIMNHLSKEIDDLSKEVDDLSKEIDDIVSDSHESEQMAIQIDSVVWFGLNYTPNFIDECWSDDPCLANHLNDKFKMCYGDTDELAWHIEKRLSYGVFTRFLTMLDNGNREKLYRYILRTYNHRKGWL